MLRSCLAPAALLLVACGSGESASDSSGGAAGVGGAASGGVAGSAGAGATGGSAGGTGGTAASAGAGGSGGTPTGGAGGSGGTAASAGAGGTIGGAAGTSATGGSAGAGAGPMRCNGHAELCDRPFDEVSFPSTHNSMSNEDSGWSIPNQIHTMTRQLEDGIRGMLIDTHDWMGGSYLCHSICDIGNQPLVEGLGEIKTFMDANPNEVVTLIIQDGISASETETAFVDSGLIDYVFVKDPATEWPTLREMIDSGERLLVTAEFGGPPPAWYHHVWDLTWDTPYSFASVDEFSCNENRGTKGNDLFLMNHWIEDPFATKDLSTIANERSVLLTRAQQCQTEGGQIPNFVAVNHYSIGALFEVVDVLNGLQAP